MEEKINQIQNWVKENYKPHVCDWTYQRSEGNYYDCFEDGQESATSWAAYTIGSILGMELEEPDLSDEDEEDY